MFGGRDEGLRVEAFPGARELHRNWRIPGGGFLLGLAGFWLWSKGGSDPGGVGTNADVLGALLMWIGFWIPLLTLMRDAFRHARPVKLRATPLELVLNDQAIPVADIMESRHVPRAGRKGADVVELAIRGRRKKLAIALPPADAVRLVSVLGIGVGERRATFTLVIPFGVRWLSSCLFIGGPWLTYALATSRSSEIATVLILMPLVIMPICVLFAWPLGLLRGRVVVGADGFTTHWFGRPKFRAFADVDAVERKPRALNPKIVDTFVYMGGRGQVRLIARDVADTNEQIGAEGQALATTMEDAYARFQRAPAAAEVAKQLGRSARSAHDWLASIDHLVRGGGGGYRIAAIAPEVLADVARAAEQSTDTRVGAAVALLRLDRNAHRTTIRIAAEASAEPKTRAALLELVEAADDEEALQAALARVP